MYDEDEIQDWRRVAVALATVVRPFELEDELRRELEIARAATRRAEFELGDTLSRAERAEAEVNRRSRSLDEETERANKAEQALADLEARFLESTSNLKALRNQLLSRLVAAEKSRDIAWAETKSLLDFGPNYDPRTSDQNLKPGSNALATQLANCREANELLLKERDALALKLAEANRDLNDLRVNQNLEGLARDTAKATPQEAVDEEREAVEEAARKGGS